MVTGSSNGEFTLPTTIVGTVGPIQPEIKPDSYERVLAVSSDDSIPHSETEGGGSKNTSREKLDPDAIRQRLIARQAAMCYANTREKLLSPTWKDINYNNEYGIVARRSVAHNSDAVSGVVWGYTADVIANRHQDTNKISRLLWDNKEISDISRLEVVSDKPELGSLLEVHHAMTAGVFGLEAVYFQFSISAAVDGTDDHKWTIICKDLALSMHPKKSHLTRDLRRAIDRVMVLTPLGPGRLEDSLLSTPRVNVELIGPLLSAPLLFARLRELQTVKFF